MEKIKRNKKGINVLSLFDGISCARIALESLNIKVNKYYSSEIDTHSIKVSKKNYPEIIQLGDIKKIKAKDLSKIDLVIGGSPCQDLSNARNGLGLKGEKSRLFYEYVRLLKEVNPKYFLLENVKNKWGNVMSEVIGTDFIEVNSSKFSAQSRPRYYWTNIKFTKIPNKDSSEKILNILEEKNPEKKYFFEKKGLGKFIEERMMDTKNKEKEKKIGIIKVFEVPKEIINDNERQRRVYSINGKSPTILARSDTTKILIGNKVRKLTPLECERLQKIPNNYTDECSDTQRYKMIGNAFTVSVIMHFLKGLK